MSETLWLFIWAFNAVESGSNIDTDREEVGLHLILNKQANLHYSRDIFPWGAKRERKSQTDYEGLSNIWRATEMRTLPVSNSHDEPLGSEAEAARLPQLLPLPLLLFHCAAGFACCWRCVQRWCGPRFKPGPSERDWQLQIGTLCVCVCTSAKNAFKQVSYFSPQRISSLDKETFFLLFSIFH